MPRLWSPWKGRGCLHPAPQPGPPPMPAARSPLAAAAFSRPQPGEWTDHRPGHTSQGGRTRPWPWGHRPACARCTEGPSRRRFFLSGFKPGCPGRGGVTASWPHTVAGRMETAARLILGAGGPVAAVTNGHKPSGLAHRRAAPGPRGPTRPPPAEVRVWADCFLWPLRGGVRSPPHAAPGGTHPPWLAPLPTAGQQRPLDCPP